MGAHDTPDRVIEPNVDWEKMQGLVPAIVQDARSGAVLMLGYMSREALAATVQTGRVTFFSRSKQRLWTKGETSGHGLRLVSVAADCDQDALLVRAEPEGPTCHLGTQSCFGDAAPDPGESLGFLRELEATVAARLRERPDQSYTARLAAAGPTRVAQKVGEEGVEVALAAVTGGDLRGEAADLLFHLLVLLRTRDLGLADVVDELRRRAR